ncbi:MAG: transglycosylase SLT domain-containing protein, partial [Pelistega sp.]|nr:transglycosylase SLT domain-containing protein [Pelistega sp.]
QAYEAMRGRRWEVLPSLAQTAQADQELGNYPMYWYLRNQASQVNIPLPTAQLQQFIQANPNTYVAERLKAEWMITAAAQGDFSTVLKLGPVGINNIGAQCAYTHAQALAGQKVDVKKALKSMKNNDRCWAMLSSLKASGQLSDSQLQQVLRDAVEYDDKAMARRYAGIFFNGDAFTQFNAIMDNPSQWLSTQAGAAVNATQAELRALAFSRLARQNRDTGITVLQSRGNELLSPRDRQWAYAQFALIAVLNQENRADEWYRAAADVPLSEYNAAWRVRAALRQPTIDWKWVEQSIDLMSSEQQQETAWLYWKGRALKAQGKTAQANALFAALNKQYDFYGQLAQEELSGKIVLPPQAAPVTAKELAHIKQNTGLQRAVALFNLGWRAEAVAEWGYAIGGLNDRDLMAAAEWAKEEHIYDRVINTSMLTKHQVNFKQRYIAPFEGRVGQQARSVGIEPSWVYGLIRQESRFVPVARSSVGASGLMQVMPGTARLVASKIGMSDFSPSRINEFETNTILGTNYLRMTLEDLSNNEVLATAGYNAGPNRPKRWRQTFTQPVEGAIFAETIPFTETRLYVKHVLSNAIWYDGLFNQGKVKSLKQRLGMVSPW